ncbi:Golgin subfamily A member 1 [Labeo rohita]|uniref:Golgin subfamily A member 1 n=1 Tax=Labeo rohita TaxID=84645 RepID=A0ABQ8MGN2_LABRO|nr:Golgin subfamily A member 1 [Labeo rohita]
MDISWMCGRTPGVWAVSCDNVQLERRSKHFFTHTSIRYIYTTEMFAKLKKKLAEEAATAPRSGRIPRSMSKESITSVGADSGDDFASDGSSSRDDVSSQIQRRNDQIRKLEAKLSDYAEQLRLMQKTKEKLEIALEKYQDSSMRKLQDQNETFQANRAKMAEGMALALEKKDQDLFQKRDDLDELEGFQQQELAKVKHMLLRREEQLSQREKELKLRGEELNTARQTLSQTQDKLYELGEEHEEMSRINSQLQAQRDELLSERTEAERRVVALERREQELQQLIQQVSEDFQKAQSNAKALEKSMEQLQSEHNKLKLQHEQHKNKVAVTEEERERLLANLQEKAASLERRLEANFSQDEHLQELLKEKSLLEQRLEQSRGELLEERTNHTIAVSSLEAQISRQNASITDLQTLVKHKEDSSKAYRERTDAQISDLEQRLAECTEKMKSLQQQLEISEAHAEKLKAEWAEERERLQQQVSTQRQRGLEKTARLEEELLALQKERETEASKHQDNLRLLEEEKASLLKSKAEVESTAELISRQTVSVEIAKALEETRKQREELQQQVSKMTETLEKAEQEVSRLAQDLGAKEEELNTLKEELHAARSSLSSLQAECESRRLEAEEQERELNSQLTSLQQEILTKTQQLSTYQTRVSDLESEVLSLTAQSHADECDGEQNGTVTVSDLDQLQKVNKDMEQQLAEKNKTIKQLQQRLAELKRTLQKELKLKPDPDSETKERLQESRQERSVDKTVSETQMPATAPTPAPGLTQTPGPPPITPNTTVTNSSDLTDTREINFEYLKHVVLKFMSSREAEAFQLIRAVSVLLHFTKEEEDMLKQTLEYKMSWFGSKPSPKGIIRPSISGTSIVFMKTINACHFPSILDVNENQEWDVINCRDFEYVKASYFNLPCLCVKNSFPSFLSVKTKWVSDGASVLLSEQCNFVCFNTFKATSALRLTLNDRFFFLLSQYPLPLLSAKYHYILTLVSLHGMSGISKLDKN